MSRDGQLSRRKWKGNPPRPKRSAQRRGDIAEAELARRGEQKQEAAHPQDVADAPLALKQLRAEFERLDVPPIFEDDARTLTAARQFYSIAHKALSFGEALQSAVSGDVSKDFGTFCYDLNKALGYKVGGPTAPIELLEAVRELAAAGHGEAGIEGRIRGYSGYPLGELVNVELATSAGEQTRLFPIGTKVRVTPLPTPEAK